MPTFEQRLVNLNRVLPPAIKQQAIPLIAQMKAMSALPSIRYTPLKQLKLTYPRLTDQQLAVMAFYVLLSATPASKLDSLSGMSEMESVRIQLAMAQTSAFMQTLGNLFKMTADSEMSIVQKLK